MSLLKACLYGNKRQFTCAVRHTVTPEPSGGAGQCLFAIQEESLFTGKKTLGAKGEVTQRMGAVQRQVKGQGTNGLTLYG